MKYGVKNVLSVAFFSVALLGAMSVVGSVGFVDAAYAQGGKSGGNGGGKGNGSGGKSGEGRGPGGSSKGGGASTAGPGNSDTSSAGKSDPNGKSQGKAHSKAPDTVVGSVATKTPPGKGGKLADVLGAHPSELGALNAAHASGTALANANPNSRVGRIAAYRNAVLGRTGLLEAYNLTRAELEATPAPARGTDAIDAEFEQVASDLEQSIQDRAVLQGLLDNAQEGDNTLDLIDQIATLDGTIGELTVKSATLGAEQKAAQAYADLVAKEAAQRDALANQTATELSLLQAAANKPVTEAVVTQVNTLLDLAPVELIVADAPKPLLAE